MSQRDQNGAAVKDTGVFIVVRHVHDIKDDPDNGYNEVKNSKHTFGSRYIWKQKDGSLDRKLDLWGPYGNHVTTSDDGYGEAARYKDALPGLIKDHNKKHPEAPWGEIRHIYVHDPRPYGTTSNPFESVFPLIRADIPSSHFTKTTRNRITPERPESPAKPPSISDVNPYPLSGSRSSKTGQDDLRDVMTDQLKADLEKTRSHSTVCCFTRDTLFGPRGGKVLRGGTLLDKMNKLYAIKNPVTKFPLKGTSVYVYYRDENGKGHMDYQEL
eukprot:scaffold524_cov55-Attheya_sp.AAC.5